jgi:nucleotide-binding universal stress UspA family protein
MTSFRRILVPTDFSPTAGAATQQAVELAKTFGAELVLLHVVPPMVHRLRTFGMAAGLAGLQDELRQRAAERLQQTAAEIGAGPIHTEVREGSAFEQVLACARDCQADLIVIGTQGHTGLQHALLGSTAERVVRFAHCPVLTVRSTG